MSRGLSKLRSAISRSLMCNALLVVLILRATIPVGYMPDMAAAHDGIFRFVDCRLHAVKAAHDHAVAETAAHHEHHHPGDVSQLSHDHGDDSGTASDVCPFAACSTPALVLPWPTLPLLQTAAAPVTLSGPAAFDIPAFKVGTQLGSRAPPLVL